MKPLVRIINYNALLKEVFSCAKTADLHDQLEPLQNAIDEVSKFMHNIKNVIMLNRLHNFNVHAIYVNHNVLFALYRYADWFITAKRFSHFRAILKSKENS